MFGVCSIMKLVVAISAMVVAILAVLMYQYGLGIFFGSGTTLTDSARYNIQTGLMNVKVDERDVTEFRRQAQMELLDTWDESFKVNEEKGISVKDIPWFLNHVQRNYVGVTDEIRSKMESIRRVKNWEEKSFEFKCDDNRECHAVYAIMAFGRSNDKQSIDYIHALYRLDFKVAPKIIERRKENSILWGLYNWESIEYRKEEYTLGMKAVSQLRSYVRYKVMEGFYNEGFIDTLNKVNEIEYDEDY